VFRLAQPTFLDYARVLALSNPPSDTQSDIDPLYCLALKSSLVRSKYEILPIEFDTAPT
jgi:hypothetical protein